MPLAGKSLIVLHYVSLKCNASEKSWKSLSLETPGNYVSGLARYASLRIRNILTVNRLSTFMYGIVCIICCRYWGSTFVTWLEFFYVLWFLTAAVFP